ncbi:ABC transporter permease [Marinoscillum furvescens]|uniref:Putative ABC transport system permease protein n=1 Tax=Marinoscillum furvescens DSM 4134 TaxID=1122208 RepID=A0A3D9L2K0_MARFU|nr:ABC transporter permease [Marinoscillum furvescens]RED96665.1 putative ABC transport system permease protein [Marinoscillum furvescens DSM 4134]
MLTNYLKITIRQFQRQPGYAALNILGLTLGIASSLLIILYLHHETSFDQQHTKANRIFRISSDITEPDNAFRWAVTQMPLGRKVAEDFAEVENYVRFIPNGRTHLVKADNRFIEEKIYLVDSTVFSVFDFQLLAGDEGSALDNPSSIVLSESLAKKIFGDQNPVGQLLQSDGESVEVTGVYADPPVTSHIRPRAMISASTADRSQSQNWGGFGIYTYILLHTPEAADAVQQKLNTIIDEFVAVIFDQFGIKVRYELINLRNIHLHSTFEGEPEAIGSMKYIYIFLAVALFLVMIASINYMNLATARSMKRALEVGIRKVMGAQRSTLIRQFITESILLTLAALVLSIGLLLVLVPWLNDTLQTHLSLANLFSLELLSALLIILLITGVASGSYPAFYLSGFRPAAVLKGKGGKAGNKKLRSTLVALQFAISIFMLIGTLIIYDQMNYLRNKDMGFDKDRVIRLVQDNPDNRDKWPVLKQKLLQHPEIKSAATASTSPGRGFGKNVMSVETNTGIMEEYGVDAYAIDYDYFTALSIPIVAGRNISPKFPSDTATAVLVNESMVSRMGWENPIGKKFQFDQDSTVFHKVIGVVKDFHQRSLYDPIEALLFIPSVNNSNILVKISGSTSDGLTAIRQAWESTFPNTPFEYSFLDQDFMEAYETDQLRGRLFLGFSIMMILISILGLLGLASFTAEQRTKEISIRKVLGATSRGLVSLLVRDFIVLVLIGALPAFVLAYFFMNEWLASFEYHVELNFLLFILVLLIIGTITMFTIGYYALRAANTNPADQLKYE